ncbi:MAG TPA: TIGR03118 family protein [Rhizomicrobium sp.]|jgi:uncharacterized protein (TIGR03118 family)
MRIRIGIALAATMLAVPAMAGGLPPAKSTFTVTNLVSDQAGVAANTDADLVNPWGISRAPGAPNWVSDNGTDKSTVYDESTGSKSLSVNIPMGAPTGTVYSSGLGFTVTKGSKSGDAEFLFDSESGVISGWSSAVDFANAVVAVDNSAKGSVYKGLEIDPTGKQIYAADFVHNDVEIYNNKFKLVGKFTDPGLPKHFAPFNVALLNGKLYVAFAKRKPGGIDEIDRKGLGYIDVFDTSGNLQQTLIANGKLDAPWGMTIAPSGFGKYAGDLLVGNFGDGHINVFDPNTGDYMGMLHGADGKTLVIDGLWALLAGPGSSVTFSAGPDDESHGLLGLISPN